MLVGGRREQIAAVTNSQRENKRKTFLKIKKILFFTRHESNGKRLNNNLMDQLWYPTFKKSRTKNTKDDGRLSCDVQLFSLKKKKKKENRTV